MSLDELERWAKGKENPMTPTQRKEAAEEAVIQEYEREYGLTFGEESALDPRSGKFSNPETILFDAAVRRELKLQAYERAVKDIQSRLKSLGEKGKRRDVRYLLGITDSIEVFRKHLEDV